MNTFLAAEDSLSTSRVTALTQGPRKQSTALDSGCGRLRTQTDTSAPHSPALLEALELLHLVAYFGDPLILGRCPDRTAGNFFPIAPDSAGNGADSAHENP